MGKLIKSALASAALTLVLAGTGIAGASAAQAAPAGAVKLVTYGSPQKWQTGGTYCPVMMYADYNWWEETFLWKRDGWELQYYAYC